MRLFAPQRKPYRGTNPFPLGRVATAGRDRGKAPSHRKTRSAVSRVRCPVLRSLGGYDESCAALLDDDGSPHLLRHSLMSTAVPPWRDPHDPPEDLAE